MLRPFDSSALRHIFEPAKSPSLEPMIATGRTLRTKEEKRRLLTIRNTGRAIQQIGKLPTKGESLHLLLKANSFDLFALLPAMLDIDGTDADEVVLATLGINSRHVEALDEMFVAGRIKRCSLVLSHYFSKVDKGEFAHAVEVFGRHRFPVGIARSHAKVIGIRFGKRAHYVVESSGNLRSCRSIEQCSMFNDSRLFKFHAAWISEILAGGDK